MLRPASHITFIQQGSGRNLTFSFAYLADLEINQSIDTLTDTCTIKLPRRVYRNGKLINLAEDTMNGQPFFKRGDKVIVKLGYGTTLKTRFIGYIRDVKSGVPITISCDDSMFLLKKGKVNHTFAKECKVEDVLKVIIPSDIEWVALDRNVGAFRTKDNPTPAKILEEFRTNGYSPYFRNITENGATRPVLYVGQAFWVPKRKEGKFIFANNIINGDDLIYRKNEDVRLKVKAISIKSDNSRIEVEVGDEDGEIRTDHYWNKTKDELKKEATIKLEKYKFTGFRGSIPTFGEPAMEKGDVAVISGSNYYPDGKYLIKAVRITCGMQGYKQTLTLDQVLTS